MKTGPFSKPAMNQRGFVSPIVVQNKMNLKRTGNVGIKSVKEFTKLSRSVPAMQLANDLPVLVSRAANNEVVPCLR